METIYIGVDFHARQHTSCYLKTETGELVTCAREEVLEECFADLLEGLIFDDEVMDWIGEALHQSHSDAKRTREEAIARLRGEQTKLQNRLDRLYEDRLDGFIEPAFFERKTREWKHTQARLIEQIAQHEAANHNYFVDGVRLLELSKKAYFLFKKQKPHEKRRLLNFVCSNSIWKDRTLTATFRQPFDILAVTNTAWQTQKVAGACSGDLRPVWLPAVDTLRNLSLTSSTIRFEQPY